MITLRKLAGFDRLKQIFAGASLDFGPFAFDDEQPPTAGPMRRAWRRFAGPRAGDGSDAATSPRRWGLLVFEEGRFRGLVPLTREGVSLGRDGSCEVQLFDHAVSRHHCTFRVEDGAVVVSDLTSTNGTYRHGRRLRRNLLQEGDEVCIGGAFVKMVDLSRGDWSFDTQLFDSLYRDLPSGLLNRRGFWLHAEALAATAPTDSRGWFLLGSVDRLAEAGRRHGVQAGAAIVAHVGRVVAATVGSRTACGWIGREEFAVFATGAQEDELWLAADEIRNTVAASAPAGIAALRATVSLGGASAPVSTPEQLRALYGAADTALFRACSRGGNAFVQTHALLRDR